MTQPMRPQPAEHLISPQTDAAEPIVLWFTGLSGAGKSTVAALVEQALIAHGRLTARLDGDELRRGLCADLGFSDADRRENSRRITEVTALLTRAGVSVLVSAISPFRQERDRARRRFGEGSFFEVFVEVPLAVAEARDPKGLYARARRGEIPRFTGISSPYEAPETPEIHLDTDALSPDQAAAQVLDVLVRAGRL
jgi:adenylyl-sulfate kinase